MQLRAPLPTAALLIALAPAAAALQSACWQDGAPCPQGRFEGHSFVIDGKMYVLGGFGKGIKALTRVDVLDPLTGAWSTRADLPAPVTHVGLALDDLQRTAWLAGGFVGDNPGVATDAVWSYDVDQDVWSPGPPLPRPVAGGGFARLGRELHWFGGFEADRDTNVPDHWVLDLDDLAQGWSSLAPLPQPRGHVGGAALLGRVHAIGGQFAHDTSPVDLDFHHAYDPLSDTWSEVAPLPFPRSHFESGTFLVDGKVVIVGGRSIVMGLWALSDVTAYDPTSDVWMALPPLPQPRLGPTAELLGTEIYVTAGTLPDFDTEVDTWYVSKDVSTSVHLRINCGGGEYVSPVDGAVWCPDYGFLAGDAFANPAVPDIANTDEDDLFRTYRTSASWQPGELRYSFPAAPGKYRLRLRFAEILHGATGYGGPSVGQRIMRFVVEGTTQKSNYDVAQEVGVETATDLLFDFDVEGVTVDLVILTSQGEPMVSAIEMLGLPEDAFEVFCPSNPNSTGAPADIRFTGSSSLGANELTLFASPVPSGFGVFFYGRIETDVPMADGRRCVAAPFVRLPAKGITTDTLVLKVNLGNPPNGGEIMAGSTWLFQGWFRDPAAGGAGSNTSAALRMHFTD